MLSPLLIPMNLQLFAGGEEQDVADPVLDETVEDVVDEPDEVSDPAGEEEQDVADPVVDDNARYAAARRQAEARVRSINERVASRFGGLVNPLTGKPIQSAEDYFDALDAQEQINLQREMQEKGVDPALIDRAIQNSPLIRQAQMAIQNMNLQEGNRELERQMGQLSQLYPEVRELSDIVQMETFPVFDRYVRSGLSLVDAFRLANFDSLAQRDAASAKQAAINAARGKGHLLPVGGGAPSGTQEVEIPADELQIWKDFYPDLSMKELRKKYNQSL